MADLQAEIELTVELRKFCNIDLFVQGYYQVRAAVKCAPRIQSTAKVEMKSECPSAFDDSNDQIYPACVFNEWGVSKTFLIIYKNEEVQLDDQINFKLSVIVDAQNITECFNRLEMQLLIELYFIEKDYSLNAERREFGDLFRPEKMPTMQQLCSRSFKLHFNPRLGLHTHVPILFDYFHLSALTTTIHGSLLCLIPPYVFDRPNARRTSLFSFLFGQDLSQITTDQLNPALLDRAYQLHNTICEILLSAYESLQDYYEKMIEHLPSTEEKPVYAHHKCRQKLKTLSEKLRTLDDIHTIDNLAHAHIAQCSAENIMLWCQFIQIFGMHESTAIALAKEYHLKRVKRLAEGFFLRETSRINLLTNESDSFSDLHDLVRNSLYYSRLPHLPIECPELDGTPDTLPIIVEEVYSSMEDQPSSALLPWRGVSSNASSSLQTVQNLSKSPSALGSAGKVEKSNPNSSVLPPKSLKQSKLASPPAAPLVHASAKGLLSSRQQSSRNANPVLALSNDPSVRLTSFRKVDEGISSASASSTLQSNASLPSGLFAYQSDSNITRSTRTRSNSSGLIKQASRHSLPDVPFQRSNSLSKAESNLNNAPIVPEFLSSGSEVTNDDVFSSPEQETAVASEFGDSSMKSKVLQASFRGKAGTMDRRTTSTSSRSLSNSSPSNANHEKRPLVNATRYFTSKADDQETNNATIDRPENCSLDSVLSLTLQLEQTSNANIERRHTVSTDDIDPLLLNGLTNDENTLNLMEKANGHAPSTPNDDEKDKRVVVDDRIQHNSAINSQTIEYVVHKENLKKIIQSKYASNLMFYSDFSTPVSTIPYYYQELVPFDSNGVHLIICVHGLDGNSGDLRLLRTYLELSLPMCRLDFLMSSANHTSTFDDIDVMVKQLIEEIDTHIERYGLKMQRISFVGHSLGNLIVRAAVSHPRFERYRRLLYTYLSLSGPHLGTLFNTSGLVNMGMWLMQKWKKSCSLSQMSFKDHINPKETYLYKLSKSPCLEFFKNILLIASPQDRYVPFHSARIEICKAALKDTAYGSIYVEMIDHLLGPIVRNPSINFVRYNAFHNIPSGTNNLIGRAAHIAILDSELFVEKLILVSAAKYFK